MLSDIKRELVEATGALNDEGVADRVTFIVDPNNEIQFVSVTAGSVGRNVDEVLRVLDALQSDELCACNWRKGDPTHRRRRTAQGFCLIGFDRRI